MATQNPNLREHVDVIRLTRAWEQVSRPKALILRCRIVDLPIEHALLQVQADDAIEWDSCRNIEEYFRINSRRSMNLNQPLTRLTIIDSAGEDGSGRRSCLLSQHHALYDGYSLKLLFQGVSEAYLHPLDDVNSNSIPTAAVIPGLHKTCDDDGQR
jgi:hypothetical protein